MVKQYTRNAYYPVKLIEQAKVADQSGLDIFAVGEHHRGDFAVSAPAVVLAAMAENTRDIKLSSAVTVLSSDDPVRVFQQFATLDLISGGRAEIIAGRGSYIESFPLFGYDLNDYSELFADKLDLLQKLRAENPVTWQGTTLWGSIIGSVLDGLAGADQPGPSAPTGC